MCENRYKTENKEFIEQAFQKLYKRGWLAGLAPSTITEADIAKFEQKHQIKLSELFKTYLMSYQFQPIQCSLAGIMIAGIICTNNEAKDIKLATLEWYWIEKVSELSDALNCFREEAREWDIPKEKYKNLVPFGYMDGWYCLDLNQINQNIKTQENDSPVVLLRYGDNWTDFLDKEGFLHGEEVAPSFRTMLEWYFCGSFENEYEKLNHVTVNYEFYQSWLHQIFKVGDLDENRNLFEGKSK